MFRRYRHLGDGAQVAARTRKALPRPVKKVSVIVGRQAAGRFTPDALPRWTLSILPLVRELRSGRDVELIAARTTGPLCLQLTVQQERDTAVTPRKRNAHALTRDLILMQVAHTFMERS